MDSLQQFVFFASALVAGMGLVLVAMKSLSTALQSLADRFVSRVINKIDNHSIAALGVGAVVALFLQSTTTTSMMAVSFATSGLLNLTQLLLVLIGSSLGTAMTPFLLTLNFGLLDFLFIAVGAFPMIQSRWEFLSNLGRLTFSIGLLWLGFRIMYLGADDVLFLESVRAATLGLYEINWLNVISSFFFGVILSIAVRSSVSIVGAVMMLLSLTLIPIYVGMLIIFGMNVGLTVPVVAAALPGNLIAKRGALALFISNFLIACIGIVSLPFLKPWLSAFLQDAGQLGNPLIASSFPGAVHLAQVAPYTHLIFNLALFVLFTLSFPLLRLAARLSLSQPDKKEPQRLQFAGRSEHMAPTLAIEQVNQEVKKMAAMVETMLQLVEEQFSVQSEDNPQQAGRILKYEEVTDRLQSEIRAYLARVMETPLSPSQTQNLRRLYRLADDLESIADYCEEALHSEQHLREMALGDGEPLRQALHEYVVTIHQTYQDLFPSLTGLSRDLQSTELSATQEGRMHESISSAQKKLLTRLRQAPTETSKVLIFGRLYQQLTNLASHIQRLASILHEVPRT